MLTLQLRSTTSGRGQGQDTQPGPPIAPHRLIPMGTQTPRESQCVTEMSNCGLHSSYPRIGGGNTEPHLRDSREDILTSLPPIHTIEDWIRALHTHSHEGFAALFDSYNDGNCTPCWDVSRAALLRPSQILHYTYGNWQSELDVQDCLEDIFRLLRLDPSISLMQQQEMDQIALGNACPPT